MILIYPNDTSAESTNVDNGTQDYMFDSYLNTQTEYSDLIEVGVDADNSDRVMLFNLDAYSVDLELTDDDAGSVVMSKSIDLSTDYGYYQSWIIESIYIYANATLKITINKSGGTAKCGICRVGQGTFIGKTQYGPKMGFLDYSIKDVDDWGRTYLDTGLWAKEHDVEVQLDTETVDNVYEDLANARGQLVAIECNENDTDYEALRLFCFIPSWDIKLNYAISTLTMTLRGNT
jgi:hypothetical protein